MRVFLFRAPPGRLFFCLFPPRTQFFFRGPEAKPGRRPASFDAPATRARVRGRRMSVRDVSLRVACGRERMARRVSHRARSDEAVNDSLEKQAIELVARMREGDAAAIPPHRDSACCDVARRKKSTARESGRTSIRAGFAVMIACASSMSTTPKRAEFSARRASLLRGAT
jgi:hypothetical protein